MERARRRCSAFSPRPRARPRAGSRSWASTRFGNAGVSGSASATWRTRPASTWRCPRPRTSRIFCTLQGVSRTRVEEVLDLVGLAAVLRRPAGLLSRGMQQRLAIGRAILHDPKLLVLDEPDASLGSDGAELLAGVMRERTVVLADSRSRAGQPPVPEDAHAASRPLGRHRDSAARGQVTNSVRGRSRGGAQGSPAEWRTRELVPALAQFVILALVIANFGFQIDARNAPSIAPRHPVARACLRRACRVRPRVRGGARAGSAGGAPDDAGLAGGDFRGEGAGRDAAAGRMRGCAAAGAGPVLRHATHWQVVAAVLLATIGMAALGCLFAAMVARFRAGAPASPAHATALDSLHRRGRAGGAGCDGCERGFRPRRWLCSWTSTYFS